MIMERTSTSFSSSTPQWKYDVFLSFRGEDTRKSFTDHLYTALERHGVLTFKDDPELQKGKAISPELFTAIQESRFALIVLSKNYASSTWCLDELLKILECMEAREAVLPIFYDVDRSDVRKQTRSFAEAFSKHEKKLRDDTEKVQMWRDALRKVTNFSGWDSKGRNVYEKSGVPHLQKQLLSMVGMKMDDIWHAREGATLIRRFLRHKKVLLILDDVNHLDQLEYLAGKHEWFGSGSRVLITTRNEHLLIAHGVERRSKVEGLGNDEALQIFCRKAFRKAYPEENHLVLSSCVVNYAKGVPLALKVLGSFFYGKDTSAWKSAVDKLREVCNSEIMETLKLSYDGLDDDEKKIFLDIACFFNGKGKDRVRETLDACGLCSDIAIRVLVEKSLLTINPSGTLLMHDLLQDMGREIVRQESLDEPGKRSRLWRSEDVNHVLSKNTGTEAIEGIVLHQVEPRVVCANANSFSMMKRLRFLVINNVDLLNKLEYLPNSLRILDWLQFPLKSLPPSFNPKNLHELNMRNSCIEHLWKGMTPSYYLKMIDLSHSLNLVKTPDFRGIPSLERLILQGCIRLHEVDPSVVVLERLTLMNLKDCKNLVLLPSRVCGLKSLRVFNVFGCSKLEKLPEDLGHVESLEELDVSGTAIREPPASIRLLKNLKVLSLRGFKGPSSNPWNVLLLPFRSFLRISSNPTTSSWLPCLSGLHSLTQLNLRDCNLSERALPNDLGCLSSLTHLDVSRNAFVSLPKSICQLSRLEFLDVGHCQRLETLPELQSSIYYLEAYNCNSLVASGLDIIRLFANCLKQAKKLFCMGAEHIESECNYLHPGNEIPEWYNLKSAQLTGCSCEFIVPGNEIPEWFNHKSVGSSSVSVELHPGWSTDYKWMGFALCVVFAIHGNRSLSSPRYPIYCQLSVNGGPFCWWPVAGCSLGSDQSGPDHLWLYHVPCQYFFFTELHTRLEFLFLVNESIVEVKKSGIRIAYEEDVEALIKQTYSRQSRVSICKEVLEFPNSDCQKASPSELESKSGGIATKRGLERCDDGAQCSENGCINEEESHPKRSKQHWLSSWGDQA
ncbi:PREDICTED: TMV resistance protein N-like isoform X2 [Prunus mume]|uniref:ADP-ribosyl cyclase/cyclic ADP-ribose hydrolase n=1 Tax=Prunus mume TaxID=102107 RepID=A0ABM1LKM4_PRUMU|nr:PREDICTED: TMV resistance protein N-like isoform X2 [Prunus mume]